MLNPLTGKIEPKIMLAQKLGEDVCGVGCVQRELTALNPQRPSTRSHWTGVGGKVADLSALAMDAKVFYAAALVNLFDFKCYDLVAPEHLIESRQEMRAAV